MIYLPLHGLPFILHFKKSRGRQCLHPRSRASTLGGSHSPPVSTEEDDLLQRPNEPIRRELRVLGPYIDKGIKQQIRHKKYRVQRSDWRAGSILRSEMRGWPPQKRKRRREGNLDLQRGERGKTNPSVPKSLYKCTSSVKASLGLRIREERGRGKGRKEGAWKEQIGAYAHK
jgi:hypothetical protein